MAIVDTLLFSWFWLDCRDRSDDRERAGEHVEVVVKSDPVGLRYTYPTDQRDLHETGSLEVYQPTASGRVESALYGTTRTVQRGGRLVPAFHAGLDIAAIRRDRHGRPLDKVYAASDGIVAYANRIGGNSSYGIYVVLTHPDPIGDIYTLYSHLASVADEIKKGRTVLAGDVLGVMGNTASTGIPMQRAHLHFEIGLINNMRFHAWYRKQKLIPDHGTFHGYNLTAVNPLALYGSGEAQPVFSMLDHLRGEVSVFDVIFCHDRPLDYFTRYPALWDGPPHEGSAMIVAVSEGGVLLSGRTAKDDEMAALGGRGHLVRHVVEDMSRRNGRGLITSRGAEWRLTRHGEQWLDIYIY